MNKNLFRVIFNAARGLYAAVQETATGSGKGRSTGVSRKRPIFGIRPSFVDMLSMRHVAFAALCVFGLQPVFADAQVVAAPTSGSRPVVGVAGNGVPLVQIATPNGAGVSNNPYTQFNVGTQGLILNNSPGNLQTQLGGYVAGNANLVGGSARVIVNQVVGGNPSQLLGYTEVAGQKADVILANPSGIFCSGCGFINTSRGVLTTGTPVFGGTGSLDAFHVTGGQIQIGSAGLNGSNVDQVDLIARSVAVNGKVWANQSLNVVTGNNDVRYSDLGTQSLGPDGNSPGVAIDVAQLGGMYAGKIRLVGTEAGVGVNSAGTIASQAGDVQLSSQGKVTLFGTTTANGNVAIQAAGDVTNSGSVYATQNATVSSQGQVGNSGTIAALGNTGVTGAGVNSTGVLGAGIDANGNVTGTGSLSVAATGAVSATGQQLSGGDLTLSGSSLTMGNAQTSAKGNAALTATGAGGDTGNIVHTGASLQIGGSLTANAAGTFTNDQGQIGAGQLGVAAAGISNRGGTLTQSGAGATTLSASGAFDNTGGTLTTNGQNAAIQSGSLTNANGTLSHAGAGALNIQTGALDNSHGSIATNGQATIAAASLANGSGSIASAQALGLKSNGDIDNTAGQIEAAGAVNVSGANVQNTAGRIVSENADGLTLTAGGQITNAAGTTAQGATGGVIGGNGNATIQAGSLTSSGTVTAAQTLATTVTGALNNNGGSMSGATINANAASLTNANGSISANTVSLTAPQLDNSNGQITANQLNLSATNLTNGHGTVTQLGSGAMGVNVSGALDNSNGGVLQTNSTDLTLAPSTLNNNGGTITHAGTGTLTINAGSGAGALTNAAGKIVTNGKVSLSAGSVDDTGGTISSQTGLSATVAGALNNTNGQLTSNGDLGVTSGAAIKNAGGTIAAAGNGSVQAQSLANSGSITAGQTLATTVAGALDNSGGTMGAQTLTASAATLTNANGLFSGSAVSLTAPQFDNSGGKITANQLAVNATNLTNHNGTLTQLGSGAMGVNVSNTLDNSGSGVIQTNSTDLTLAPASLNNNGGTITHAGTGTLTIDAGNGAGTLTNAGGKIVTNGQLTLSAGSVDDTGGAIAAQTGLSATVTGALNNTNGQIASNANLGVSSGTDITNTGGTIASSGNTTLQAASLTNGGSITAGQNLGTTVAGTLDNSNGTLSAQSVTTHSGSLRNANGVVSGNSASLTAPQLDNSGGKITANQLDVTAANLTNHGGTFTQLGSGAMGVSVSGTLDNSNGGVLQTNSTDLTLTPASLNNNGGTVTHAGTGTLTIDAGNGAGAVTNVNGSVVSNGSVALSAGNLDDTGGAIGGQAGLTATVAGTLTNTNGQLVSNADLSVTSGAITNAGGKIAASGNNTVQAATLTNGGSITGGQNLGATVSGTLDNSNGTLSAQSVTASAASFKNASGVVSGNTVQMTAQQFDNSRGRIIANQLALTAPNLTNEGGSITQLGTGTMGLGVSGTLDNSNGGVIQTNSTDLTLAPSTLNNNGGTITHAGTGTLSVNAGNGAGTVSNVGGKIVTNGQASVSGGSLDNTGGTLASQGVMSVTDQGTLNNTGGRLSSGTGVSASSGGALLNAGGVIGAGGVASGSTLSLSAASIDNTGGAITNVGTGATTVSGGSQITNSNAAGASGMGSISGNGDVTLNAISISNTQGGQLGGANLQINAGNLDNSGGAIGNVGNVAGDVGITTGTLAGTSGRINASRNLAVTANALSGGGAYSAVNNLSLNLQGDFATSANYSFSAGNNLSFTLPGTFSNGGSFSAVNGLSVNAGDITNSGTLAAGGQLTTRSNTLTNTGTIVGGSVSLNASQTLSNLGPSALIGATDSAGTLELLSADIENRDDTTGGDTQATTAIYGLGNVVLAGGKDVNGNYTRANLIHNQSGLIQSGGDMTLAANQVTNTRRVMTTSGSYDTAVDPALLSQLGISLQGCDATYMAACGPGNPQVLGSKGDPSLIGGVPTDPPHGGQWNSTYQYTTYTGVALANLVTSTSPQSQIIAGGNINASSVGTLQNYWSQVAAGGNIAAPHALDQESWQGQTAPGVQVTYSGEYHYDNYDNSEHNWQLPFGNAGFVTSNPGGYAQAAPADIRTYALPAYESTYTARGTISGTGVTINNTAGNAGVTPLGLLPGQSVSGGSAGSVNGTINAAGVGAVGAGAVSGAIGTGGVAVTGAGAVSGSVGTGGGTHSTTVAVQGGRVLNSGLANSSNPTVAAATAGTVLNNITVPSGGLFHRDTAPNAPYLVETNPAFANQQQWLSSDYYFQQMGLNPAQTQMRLGDGFYEQKLVQDQILSMTGKSVLTNYADTQDEFKALMTSGAALAKSLDLAPGTGLSPDQVAQLTSNVVIMQTQVVDGQSVLVPVVYLAKASQENMGNGPVIAATNIDLQNAQTVTNSGTISATNSFAIGAQSIDSSFGTLQSGGQMSLVTTGDVNLTSATVKAGSLNLQAGGNLVLDTAVNTLNQVSATGATRTSTTLGPAASIDVAGNALITTGGNFEQNAGSLTVGGALGMSIGGNWNLGVQETGETKVVARANGISDTHFVSDTGSSVKVGGTSAIAVTGDLTATGAKLDLGGGGTIVAGGNVTLQAATATSTLDSNSSGSDHHGSYAESLHTSDDAVTGTTLKSGDSLNIVSGKDINVTGSTIALTKGNVALAATGDVNIGAATETHVSDVQQAGSHSGIVSSTSRASTRDTTSTVADGSTISADGVSISSGKDLNIKGSTVVGTNDVALSAAHDVNITTTRDTMQSSGTYEEHHSGLMAGGGIAVSVGSSKLATTDQESSVTNNASTIGSLNGNLSVQAGNTLHVTGSDLIAAKNVTGTAANVILDAATDTSHQAQTQQTSKSGLTLGLSGSVGDAINNAISETQAARSDAGTNDRAAALHSIAAAGDAATVGLAAADAMKGGTPSIAIQLSVGSSHSQSQSSEDQTTQRGSSVQAGGTAAFVATGDGTPGSGNVTIAGSNVNANDVLLAAKNQVNIINTTNTDSTRSSNSSSSASVGVSYGTQGFGVSASMSNAHGDANSDAAIQNASHVNGTNSVTVVSGGDTNITGSQVNGGKVVADVGGNLNITSVQDVTNSAAHQSSAGGGFSISQGGGSASFSAQNGHADSNYAGVNEQAGINAGDGGFDVNVKGNTGLTGAVISSTADVSKNSLTTGTLTFSDVQNQSHYSASSNGIGAGVGIGSTGKAVGPGSVSGAGGVTPMISQNESGDSSATTRSAVSAGTISITNQGAQTQDVAGLSRDTTNSNGTVSKTPDVQNILSQQADTMQAAQAAGQAVSQGIGEYADHQRDAAVAQAKVDAANGDTAAVAADVATANQWMEGGDSRAELQALGGALIGGLGGGSVFTAAGGALGAGLSSKLAGQTKGAADAVTDATGSSLLGNISGNILAGVGGALVGGTAGAAMASNVDLYNRNNDTGNEQAKKDLAAAQAQAQNPVASWLQNHLPSWLTGPLDTANKTLDSATAQFTGQMNSDAQAKASQSPWVLGAQGLQNGVATVLGAGGGEPPVAPGMATAGAGVAGAANALPATPGYVPNNATLNSGGDDGNADMLGANGAQFASKTIWKGDGKERIDVENPNPGQRPGQIHYQDNQGNKYLYDPSTNSFPDAPNSVNKLLNDPGFNAAIQKGLNKYLGGN